LDAIVAEPVSSVDWRSRLRELSYRAAQAWVPVASAVPPFEIPIDATESPAGSQIPAILSVPDELATPETGMYLEKFSYRAPVGTDPY
jgi:hypothetical protein